MTDDSVSPPSQPSHNIDHLDMSEGTPKWLQDAFKVETLDPASTAAIPSPVKMQVERPFVAQVDRHPVKEVTLSNSRIVVGVHDPCYQPSTSQPVCRAV
jgi:hypothetical protein